MYVSELSREQLVELKSTMLEAILGYEPSYGELVIADELESDEQVEEEYGHSALIDVLHDYYHSDLYFTPEGELHEKYQSLKQGCSVASWLADVILYHIDEKLSQLEGYYARYSDDMLYVGSDYVKAMHILTEELGKMQMKLNPKKVEYLDANHWLSSSATQSRAAAYRFPLHASRRFRRR